jgi:23S rRNA (cytidine1920-2'-O)/16S rRNA (cytidine1409-2'-O)-methyltransferase
MADDFASRADFASRGGLKLEHALQEFGVDVTGAVCADFGCNVGGFTDCLLQRGAAQVYAVDTGYGVLDYRLRSDPRVVTMERTNALHADPPDGGVDIVTIDLGWTPQRHAIPAALRWLRPEGRIISLVKPHYELTEPERKQHLREGRLDPEYAEMICGRVGETLPDLGADTVQLCRSPITGGKSGRRKGRGNVEFLMLATPAAAR